MHSLMVLIDGWGDDYQQAVAGETAAVADLPNLKRILAWGRLHYFSICEKTAAPAFSRAVVPGSLSCILRLLGIPDVKQPRSRSYLELLASGGKMRPDQLVLRCNLVTKDARGRLAAFNSVLPWPELENLFQKIRQSFQAVEFWPQQGYKNLLLVPYDPALLTLSIAPPHESLGRPVQDLLAGLRQAAPDIGDFLDGSEELFKPYNPVGYSYGLYPWGISPQITLPQFKTLYHGQGEVVGGIGLVRGLGLAMGMRVPYLARATGDVDTDLQAKLEAVLASQADFVLVHFNGADEAAHRENFLEKKAFLARLDREFLRPLLKWAPQGLRIIICGDHATSSLTGKHTRDAVPFAAAVWEKEESCLLADWDEAMGFLMKGRNGND